jgi:DNA-binding MarR family transcriptional regulator
VSSGFLLIALGRKVREEVETGLKPYGLALRHLSALGHLSRDAGLSYSELGRRAGVTAQSMQATLRQLEELRAVERRTPAGRGRTAELHVTGRGAELLATGRTVVTAAEDRLLADLAPDERDQLQALLLRVFRP